MSKRSNRKAFILLAVATILLAGVISYFADPNPDALEHSMETYAPTEDVDEAPQAGEHAAYEASEGEEAAASPLADYGVAGLEDKPFLSGSLAGIIGIAITFLLIVGVGLLIKGGKAPQQRT